MLRPSLLLTGLLILFNQNYFLPATLHVQTIFFIAGIVFFGVPHGAADLLISTKGSIDKKKKFSALIFFTNYLGRLFLSLIICLIFPSVGLLLFIIIASFHFGETDLYQFKTDSFWGRLFVISYGLLIINVILLNHIDEIKPLFLLFNAGRKNLYLISIINHYRLFLLSFSAAFFFFSTFLFFLFTNENPQINGQFLINLAVIIFIVYNLPMLLGFAFYFVLWHSLLSLKNIISYLHDDGAFSLTVIIGQIALYSLIAFAGTIALGLTGFMFSNNNALIIYTFISLAVLTAPHMEIMHMMYKNIRLRKSVIV
jgi:Brp/Blh family beta-carotene 15,15'-monooxygenase